MSFFDQIRKEVYIISEIGINHNGDLGTALDLIEISKNAGVNAVKFQKRNLEEIYTKKILEDSNAAEWNFDYIIPILKETELSEEDYSVIKKKCNDLNIDLIITPFDLKSAEFCYNLGVKAFKISSADMVNYELIKKCNLYGLPLVISTGTWNQKEIIKCVDYYYDHNIINFALLLTNSTYPCDYADIGIKFIEFLKELVKEGQNVVGLSSHDPGIFLPIGAIALGARIIEKHITLNKNQSGPDHSSSLLPNEFKEMVSNIRNFEKSFHCNKKVNVAEKLNKEVFAKSAVAIKKIKKGTILIKELIEWKSPGKGIFPHEIEEYFGKEIKRDIEKEQYICKEDFSNDIPDWKNIKFNFKKDYGIKCRFHDYEEYKQIDAKIIEFHCSSNDLNINFKGSNKNSKLIIHAPEIVDRTLVDFCSLDKNVVDKSVEIIQKTIDKTIEIGQRFKGIPSVVVHVGGMSLEKGLEKYEDDMMERAIKNFKRLSCSSEQINILPESLPKFPWYFSGHWTQYAFTKAEHMIDFCVALNLKMCYDVCHSALYCNWAKEDLIEYTQKVKPFIQHLHISDAKNINEEGLKFGDGTIDFDKVLEVLKDKDFSWITEIWQQHNNFGVGIFEGLHYLKKYKGIL